MAALTSEPKELRLDFDATGAGVIAYTLGRPASKEQQAQSSDGKLQFDNSELPRVQMDAGVWEEWHDSKLGDVQRLEGSLLNTQPGKVKGLRLDFEPAECVLKFWNLVRIETGSYVMAGYFHDEDWKGGLGHGETIRWGGTFKSVPIKMTVRPYNLPPPLSSPPDQ